MTDARHIYFWLLLTKRLEIETNDKKKIQTNQIQSIYDRMGMVTKRSCDSAFIFIYFIKKPTISLQNGCRRRA